MAAARYTRAFMPLSKVKEKEFLSRPMGCKGVGFSFVRYRPGEGATYVHRHKVRAVMAKDDPLPALAVVPYLTQKL